MKMIMTLLLMLMMQSLPRQRADQRPAWVGGVRAPPSPVPGSGWGNESPDQGPRPAPQQSLWPLGSGAVCSSEEGTIGILGYGDQVLVETCVGAQEDMGSNRREDTGDRRGGAWG